MADNLDLVLERTLDAPRALVWKAQTRAEHLKHWFAPRPYEISECELDLPIVGPRHFAEDEWAPRIADGGVGDMHRIHEGHAA